MCLFSTLDDGTGFTPAEDVLDAWLEEGIENGGEILEVRHSADGKKKSVRLLLQWLSFILTFYLFDSAGFKLQPGGEGQSV